MRVTVRRTLEKGLRTNNFGISRGLGQAVTWRSRSLHGVVRVRISASPQTAIDVRSLRGCGVMPCGATDVFE